MSTKILIADDSVVIRRVLANVLSEEPGLEVVGTAPDGRLALAKISQTNPDLLVLDVEMPNMDGLETLKEIRRSYPGLRVIMFSQFTQLGAAVTIDALFLGAQDYVEKPKGGALEESVRQVKEKLVPKIRALCAKPAPKVEPAPAAPAVSTPPRKKGPKIAPFPADIVVIGTSTGGPEALAAILKDLPSPFPVPLLIAQHMPAFFTESLAQRLTLKSQLDVKEGKDGEVLVENLVRIAPGDFHMSAGMPNGKPSLKIFQGPLVNSCRPSVDVLLQSVAALYGERTLAVILTGMGQDGLKGCEAVREKGGQILAQDEASSVVWGMPGSVAQAGLADEIVPLSQMAKEIMRRVPAPILRTPAAGTLS